MGFGRSVEINDPLELSWLCRTVTVVGVVTLIACVDEGGSIMTNDPLEVSLDREVGPESSVSEDWESDRLEGWLCEGERDAVVEEESGVDGGGVVGRLVVTVSGCVGELS